MRQWREGIKVLSLAEQAEAFGAILDYALEGVPYDGTNPAIKMLMAMIASQIDQHNNKYAAICEKRAEASKSRWNNPKDANASKSIQKDANASKSKGCINLHHDNDSDCDGDNDNIQDKNLSSFGVKAKREGFKKPSPAEVHDYVIAQGYSWDSSSFYDYYESNGWKVGTNTMKDWRAAVRNWNRQEQAKAQQYGVHERARANQRGESAVPDWSKTTEEDMHF